MGKSKIGVRLHWHNLMDDKGYQVLMDFCNQYKEQIDEVSLFTHYSLGAYIPPEEDEETCKVYRKRIADLRARGYRSVGLNMLSTVGHGDQGKGGMPLPPIVGHDGYVSWGAACPTSEEFRSYTRRRYRVFAELKPDFLWADDDNRFYHTGALYPCFCDRCVGIFNRRHGYTYDRESLVKDMEQPDNVTLRGRWVQFVEDRIADTFSLIEETVHSVDPKIELGYMSTGMLDGSIFTYNGANFDHWLRALKAKKGRPGTTVFTDRTPMDLMVKPLLMAFQSDDYPEEVRDILYEHENYPYATYHKSHVWETAECTLALANGANGIYVNTMDDRSIYCLDESHPFFQRIVKKRPTWDAMADFSGKSVGYGFYPALAREYDKRRPLHFGESFFMPYNGWARRDWSVNSGCHDVRHAYTLSEIGVPLTGDRRHAIGTVLAGDLVDGFTVEELQHMFSGAVLLDGYALRALERRGLGHWTGVKLDRFWEGSYHERFNQEDPANAGLSYEYRDTREYPAEFGGNSGSVTLQPLEDSVRVLSWLEGFQNGDVKGVTMTLYENELGGRVCVMGYSAFTMVDSCTRRRQLMNICDYLTRGTLRAKLLTDCLAAQYIRADGNRTMVTLASLSLDGIEKPKVAVYKAKSAVYLGDDGRFVPLVAEPCGDYGVFSLPVDIPAFDTATLIAEA